ncbi:hypothetical protein GQ600_18081 [Phytophthora cactorum]|nr:hypothetical protein GQ600_18081 [Phytophthora cactorum]
MPRRVSPEEGSSPIVSEAQKRGLPLSEAYAHFDQRDEGVVSVDNLMQAVVELRLYPNNDLWSEQDAEECVTVISRGKSRAYFTREDFVRYFSTTATPSNLVRDRDVPQDNGHDRRVRFHKTSPKKRDHLQHWQEQATTVSHTLASSLKQKKKSQLRVTLPEWAHARSKRALKELEARHRTKSKQPPITLSSTPNFNTDTRYPNQPRIASAITTTCFTTTTKIMDLVHKLQLQFHSSI